MDFTTILIGFSVLWLCIQFLNFCAGGSWTGTGKIPPGPVPFPIVGNIFALGSRPHESLANLSKKYGPLMTLQLGQLTTVIVSSAEMANEVLHKNDQTFASRSIPDVARALDHHNLSIGWLPSTSARWRNLRKLCNTQLFSANRLDANQSLRQQKVQDLVAHVRNASRSGGAVDIGRAAFTTTFNLLSNTIFSVDLVDPNSGSVQNIKDLMWLIMKDFATPNPADYFPVLKAMDPLGARRRMANHLEKFLYIFDGMIKERLKFRAAGASATSCDVLDALLDQSEEKKSEISLETIKHLIMDIFVAGTDTTSTTLEWAMAELLRNPDKMAKAQRELREKFGKRKPVEESDIAQLPYLQAILKETFRLHPAVPLLPPHKAESKAEICGYTVPKDTQVLVNVWAIARDPRTWVNPDSFVPERFLESEIDVRGRHCELIPFGAGRRICPGLPLALRMLNLMLASLIQSFDWKLEDGMKAQDLDMSDKFGTSLKKAEPLRAIPILV